MKNKLIKSDAEVLTIDSREIAEMIGKEHGDLLREIEGRKDGKNVGIIPVLEKGKFPLSNFFIQSSYKSGTREYKCYLVTKMGCELIGNKQQGEKGILFTIKYVMRFNEMAEKIKEQNTYKLPQNYSEALRMLADTVDKNAKLIEENKVMKPKSDTYDKIMKSETTFAMGDIAKIINYKGMGRNNLFKFLREQEVLMVGNRPYQRYVDSGYFKEIEHDFTKESGEVIITYQTVVFQKGLDFIIKLLDKNGYKVREDKSKNDNIIELKKIINN